MFVCCECCVLPGRGLCDGPIPRPEESYRLWCVLVCDQMNNNPLRLTWLCREGLDYERRFDFKWFICRITCKRGECVNNQKDHQQRRGHKVL
jgi:hypothetical protein